jgi:hypothetical protein
MMLSCATLVSECKGMLPAPISNPILKYLNFTQCDSIFSTRLRAVIDITLCKTTILSDAVKIVPSYSPTAILTKATCQQIDTPQKLLSVVKSDSELTFLFNRRYHAVSDKDILAISGQFISCIATFPKYRIVRLPYCYEYGKLVVAKDQFIMFMLPETYEHLKQLDKSLVVYKNKKLLRSILF